jgi:hypothetical protein
VKSVTISSNIQKDKIEKDCYSKGEEGSSKTAAWSPATGKRQTKFSAKRDSVSRSGRRFLALKTLATSTLAPGYREVNEATYAGAPESALATFRGSLQRVVFSILDNSS